jgi:hypothetical protein
MGILKRYPSKAGTTCEDATWTLVDLDGNVISSGTIPSGMPGNIVSPTKAPVLREYDSSAVWNHPIGLRALLVACIAGGGGAGAGYRGAASTNRTGGGGGEAGTIVLRMICADQLGAAETIIIGSGGNGGASNATDSSVGAVGTAGGDTTFGTLVKAAGGLGGVGGIAGTLTGNSAGRNATDIIPNQDYFVYSDLANYRGGRGTSSQGEGSSVQMFKQAARFGGGGGAGLDTSNNQRVGGAGSRIFNADDIQSAAVNGGAVGGGNGDNGVPNWGNQFMLIMGTTLIPVKGVGSSGAGGGSSNSAKSGDGGDGAEHGGAGGGGAASVNGQLSGAGGKGAKGFVVVIELY